MNEYNFEGRTLYSSLKVSTLDRLAGLVIAYKAVAKANMIKAAREQEGYIKGFLYGLEVAEEIDSEDSDELFTFFMAQ
jgi:hypothetical protein